MKIDVQREERVFVIVDGKPERYLAPGRHFIFAPFKSLEVARYPTSGLMADLDADQLALVPAEDLLPVTVLPTQRALVTRRGKPVRWLCAGQHQLWTVDRVPARKGEPHERASTVTVELIDVSGVETKPLRDELKALVPASDYAELTVPEGAAGLRYVDGGLDTVLPAGRHAAWTVVRKVQLASIDLLEKVLHITGQEALTQDRVTLRLNLSATYRVADARRLATVARAPDEVLYLAMQLAAREAVATHSLDQLLGAREVLVSEIQAEVEAKAATVGLKLVGFGVKDVVLPGEMKALLNRVIEAQKEAEANVIFRREETAATRSMAQTAKVLAENPLLVRLKELEAYKDLAGKVGQIHVVLGESSLPMLQLKSS